MRPRLASLFLFAVLAPSLAAQYVCPPDHTCYSVAVPKGRKFILVAVGEGVLYHVRDNFCDRAPQDQVCQLATTTVDIFCPGIGAPLYEAQMQNVDPVGAGGTGAVALEGWSFPEPMYYADTMLMETHRGFWKAIPLPAGLTANAGVTLTVDSSFVGPTNLASLRVDVYPDARFTLTETPSLFRPQDARDPASHCEYTDKQGAHDDCHPQFTVKLVASSGPTNQAQRIRRLFADGGTAGPRVLSDAKMRGSGATSPDILLARQRSQGLLNSWQPAYLQANTGTVRPVSSREAWSSVPLQAYAAIARVFRPKPRTRKPLGNVGSAFAIGANGNPPPLTASYDFTLALPPPAPNHPAKTWLPGTSTNYSPPNYAADEPDYVFEKSGTLNQDLVPSGPLKIGTAGDVLGNVNVTVTSHDFGGVAQLRATGTVGTFLSDRQTFDADVVDATGADAAAPSCLSAAGFESAPFASLPVDQDCNGIADSWEDVHSPQSDSNGQPIRDASGNIQHLPPDWDKEPGYGNGSATAPKGDGYSVHDEYRGFHYILDDVSNGPQVRWVSTEPATKVDVFFWDPKDAATTALRAILAKQGSDADRTSDDGSLDHFKIVYRRVTSEQANAAGENPASRRRNLKINSQTPRVTGGFAVAFAVTRLNPDRFYTPDYHGGLILGDARTTSVDGTPVWLDIDAMGRSAGTELRPGIPLATFKAQVVAHETGHKFRQMHPLRDSCCTYINLSKPQLPTLTAQQFGFVGAGAGNVGSETLYIRLRQYQYPASAGTARMADGMDSAEGVRTISQSIQVPDPVSLVPVFKLKLSKKLPSTARPWVQIQEGKLMDWTPYLSLTTPEAWRFANANLTALCVKLGCHQ